MIYLEDFEKVNSSIPNVLKEIIRKESMIEKSIFEHNIYSLAKVYDNINFTSLEKFMRVPIQKVLSTAFKMVLDEKLNAKIDEINELVYFEAEASQTLNYDLQIQNFCTQVLHTADYIRKQQSV